MRACGKRTARSSVELPGPQPRSTTLATPSVATRARRSAAGRDRSASNLLYCPDDQSMSFSPSAGAVLPEPLRPANPEKQVRPQRTALRHRRMLETPASVLRHSEPLHDGERGMVAGHGDGDDLVELPVPNPQPSQPRAASVA